MIIKLERGKWLSTDGGGELGAKESQSVTSGGNCKSRLRGTSGISAYLKFLRCLDNMLPWLQLP